MITDNSRQIHNKELELTYPFNKLLESEYAVKPLGSCCTCADREKRELIPPSEYFGKDREYCENLNSQIYHPFLNYTMADGDQTCLNACSASNEPESKTTALEEHRESIENNRVYGELNKNEVYAPLEDICMCSKAGDSMSYVEKGIVKQNGLSEYQLRTWENYNNPNNKSTLNTNSNYLTGIRKGDNMKCADACDVLLGNDNTDTAEFEDELDEMIYDFRT